MNKILKHALLPLMVSFIGFSSCSPYAMKWHVISNEAASKSINEILNEQDKSTYAFPKKCHITYSFAYYNDNRVLDVYHLYDCNYDYDNNYLKLEYFKKDSTEETLSLKLYTYYFLIGKDGKGYQYCTSTTKEEEKKILIANNLDEYRVKVQEILKEFKGVKFLDLLKGNIIPSEKKLFGEGHILKKLIEYADLCEKIRKDKNNTADYYFQQKDKGSIEYNESIKCPSEYFEELKGTKFKKVTRTMNVKFEDNYINSSWFDASIFDDDDKEQIYYINVERTSTVEIEHIIID